MEGGGTMKALGVFVLFVWLSLPAFALATPVSLEFIGSFGGSGIASGSFTYDNAEGPTALNVRGLANNAIYGLTAWDFTVTATEFVLPSTTFASGLAGNTAEFCLGNCVFSAGDTTNLIFKNDQNLLMQITFQMTDPTPLVTPPADISEWGTLREAVYRVPCPICVPVTIFTSGALSGSVSQPSANVPETSSLALVAVGLGVMIAVRRRLAR